MMSWKRGLAALLLVTLASINLGHSQQPSRREAKPAAPPRNGGVPPSKEVDAIRKSAEAFTSAFNAADAKAIAALWTKDGEYIDESGERFAGREAIEREYVDFFKANPGAKLSLAVDSIRQVSDTAAIEDGRSLVELGPSGTAGMSKYSVVHVKSDGKWLMSSVRDSHSEPAASKSQLGQLEWLVGSWSAEQNGAKLEVNCRWIADKGFIERSHSLKRGDKVVTSGLQIIGWNPQAERIQSWSFTADGGHAVGLWSPDKEGWAVQMSGMLADGTPTESVNLVKPIDADAIAWSSTSRSAGGTQLPDLDEVLLRRAAAKR